MSALLELLKAPVSNKKVLKGTFVNALGVQVVRTVAAHIYRGMRRAKCSELDNTYSRQLCNEGYCILPNFLSAAEFATVKAEYERAFNSNNEVHRDKEVDGTATDIVLLNKLREFYPRLFEHFFDKPIIREILRLADAREDERLDVVGYYGCTIQDVVQEAPDERQFQPIELGGSMSDFHQDTFHNVFKGFFYLDDVPPEGAPFTYCPGSHKLTLRRLWFVYKDSILHQQNAPRVGPDALAAMGYRPVGMAAPANTLIIADTFGFHARGKFAREGMHRRTANFSYRSMALR